MMTLASAAAFAPVARVARSSAVKMSFESEIGAQPPLGFWDPLGLLTDADQERFDRLRYVETKHGRIAQLAILGHLVTTAGYRLPTSLTPGYDLSSTPTGLAALSALPSEANRPVAAALAPAPAPALHHAQTTLAAAGRAAASVSNWPWATLFRSRPRCTHAQSLQGE